MSHAESSPEVARPFPIFKLANRYLLYDVDTVSYVRREHNICGVLIGGLPQASQQNVFLGLPLQLMPEEVRLLVEAAVAYVVDDVAAHKRSYLAGGMGAEERRAYQAALRKQGLGAAKEASKRSDDRKKAALKSKMGTENWNDIPADMLQPAGDRTKKSEKKRDRSRVRTPAIGEDEALFAPPTTTPPPRTATPPASSVSQVADVEPWGVTPTTSYPPLQSSENGSLPAPDATASYPLYKHLHGQGFFLSPGLRFGCQYMAYPGDPLRFHSHFLCRGMDWDEEFDLVDLVAGGRLGTGVKKGYLIGGQKTADVPTDGNDTAHDTQDGAVRAFCIEWGGM